MKDLDRKIVAACYPLFGAFLSSVVFVFGLGGSDYLSMGHPQSVWCGPIGLLLCLAVGALLGWAAWAFRHSELGGPAPLASGAAAGILLGRRVLVVLLGLAAVYFMWRLARSGS